MFFLEFPDSRTGKLEIRPAAIGFIVEVQLLLQKWLRNRIQHLCWSFQSIVHVISHPRKRWSLPVSNDVDEKAPPPNSRDTAPPERVDVRSPKPWKMGAIAVLGQLCRKRDGLRWFQFGSYDQGHPFILNDTHTCSKHQGLLTHRDVPTVASGHVC